MEDEELEIVTTDEESEEASVMKRGCTLDWYSSMKNLLVSLQLFQVCNPVTTARTVESVALSFPKEPQVNLDFFGPFEVSSTSASVESLRWTTLPPRLVWAIAWWVGYLHMHAQHD